MLTLLNLLAGVSLLVWGTHIVRTGILRLYGADLRRVLRKSINQRFTAFLAGLGVTVHDDVWIVGNGNNLPAELGLPKLLHHQGVDQVIIQIIFGLIEEDGFLSILE